MTAAFEHDYEPDWENLDGPVLIAGDVRDFAMIADVCRRLPWDAMGVVLLEATMRAQIRHLDLPEGVGVRWLVQGESLQERTHGERLGMAVHSWCVEWTCGEPQLAWTVWLGPHTPGHVARMARSLLGVHSHPDR